MGIGRGIGWCISCICCFGFKNDVGFYCGIIMRIKNFVSVDLKDFRYCKDVFCYELKWLMINVFLI